MQTPQALTLRVLDLSRGIAGAYAARLLCDLGPACTRWRWREPAPGSWPPDPAFRAFFDSGVTVHERTAPLAGVVKAVVADAGAFDLVICDLEAADAPVAADLWAPARAAYPGLVVVNATCIGRTGPYAPWTPHEILPHALSGHWSIAGEPGRPPLRVPGFQAAFHTGLQLAIGAVAACRQARLSGQGQHVSVSGLEAMLAAHWRSTIAWTHEGRVVGRTGCDLLRTRDGWVHFYPLTRYPEIFLLTERPELEADRRWDTIAGWLGNARALWEVVGEWCARRTSAEVVARAQELRIPATAMAAAPELLGDPHLRSRGAFAERGGFVLPGLPYRWEGGLAAAAAPISSGAVAAERTAATTPLAGVRVLEIAAYWAGPVLGRHLGDLGAEVIKVELASRPSSRVSNYPGRDPGRSHWNRSGFFNEMNRNKRDVCLDLATAAGRALFLRLAAISDVVIENNSPRVMPNLGLGYEQLRAVNPRLVMASISGFGASGPRRDHVALGSNAETACGLAAMTGYGDGVPQRSGTTLPDPIAGGHAALAVVAALERRDRTGQGAHIDVSLIEAALPFMLEAFAHFASTGEAMAARGNAEPWAAPTGAYRSAGTDDWLAIAVESDAQWQALARLAGIGRPEWEGTQARIAERPAVDAEVEAWTRTLTNTACAAMLQAAGVPAAPILHNWQLHSDPHLAATRAFVPIDHPDTGVLPYPGHPWRFSRSRLPLVHAPRFAEANRYVFQELLGLSAQEVGRLYAEGVTADEPTGMEPVRV